MTERETLPAASAARAPTVFGHPAGLTVLVTTQMWAEFSYFGLQAMLVYYMTQQLGFSQAKSSLIYGAYGAAAFFSPFFGGLISDRWLGRKWSVVIGGVLMMFGHFAMAVPPLLFPALALVAIGNGLFIPPLAVQVGSLYPESDPRKSHAFSVYYMGINLGAFLAPLICGTLGEWFGWHWGFAVAGVGMLVGLIVYLSFSRLLPKEPVRLPKVEAVQDGASAYDWRKIRLLVTVIAAVVLFRIGYEQSGNVIALWVAHQTDRTVGLFGHAFTIPATWFQSINPLLIILLTPVLVGYWGRRERRLGGANLYWRMSLGSLVASAAMGVMVLAAAIFVWKGHPVGPGWVVAYFGLLTIGELMVIPVGLTLVSALSPPQAAAMAMGSWYIAKFLGSLFSGVMGAYWGVIPATSFFGLGAGATMLAALALYFIGRSEPPRLDPQAGPVLG